MNNVSEKMIWNIPDRYIESIKVIGSDSKYFVWKDVRPESESKKWFGKKKRKIITKKGNRNVNQLQVRDLKFNTIDSEEFLKLGDEIEDYIYMIYRIAKKIDQGSHFLKQEWKDDIKLYYGVNPYIETDLSGTVVYIEEITTDYPDSGIIVIDCGIYITILDYIIDKEFYSNGLNTKVRVHGTLHIDSHRFVK
jgi:hypothetical protein